MSNYNQPGRLGGFGSFPPVIKNLLLINAIVFVLLLLGDQIPAGAGLSIGDIIIKYFALIPIQGLNIGMNNYGEIISWQFYPWQLITYQFLHEGFVHLLLNVFVLWVFAIKIENLWGGRKFLYFYLLCGVAGGFILLFFNTLMPSLGSSGAVLGVLIVFGMIFPDELIFNSIKAKYIIVILFFIQMLFFSIQSIIPFAFFAGSTIVSFGYILYFYKNSISIDRYAAMIVIGAIMFFPFFEVSRQILTGFQIIFHKEILFEIKFFIIVSFICSIVIFFFKENLYMLISSVSGIISVLVSCLIINNKYVLTTMKLGAYLTLMSLVVIMIISSINFIKNKKTI